VNDDDLLAQTVSGIFNMWLKSVLSEKHIEMDQGRCNFVVVAVDRAIGKTPVVVAAEKFDLRLSQKYTASDVVLKLLQETQLISWMQQTDDSTLPNVDRVILHIEQMSVRNPNWKHFGLELGKLLQQKVADRNSCIVKMSSPHLLRAGDVIHHLGEEIVDELKLVAVSYGKKKRKATMSHLDDVEPSSSDTGSDEDTAERDVDY